MSFNESKRQSRPMRFSIFRIMWVGSLLAAAVALPGSSASASVLVQETVLDSFQSNQTVLVILPAPPIQSDSDILVDSTVLGGERELTLEVSSSPGLVATSQVVSSVFNGVLNVANQALVESDTFVRWDGIGSAGLAGFDSALGGADAFAIDLVAVDQSTELTLTVVDTSSNVGALTLATSTPGLVGFAYADFSGTADFGSLDSIELSITGPAGYDAVIESFSTARIVPEPTGLMSVASLALIGFLGVSQRHRRIASV